MSDDELGAILDVLQQILVALKPTVTPSGPPKVVQWTSLALTLANTNPTPLSKTPILAKLVIVQNVTNNTTSAITIGSQAGVGPILNPPSTAGLAGGSYPISAPTPDTFVDLSQIFITAAAANDKVVVGYV